MDSQDKEIYEMKEDLKSMNEKGNISEQLSGRFISMSEDLMVRHIELLEEHKNKKQELALKQQLI